MIELSKITESYWVLVRVVKYSSIPHFVTFEGKTSLRVTEAQRYSSEKSALAASKILKESLGQCIPRFVRHTSTYNLHENSKYY